MAKAERTRRAETWPRGQSAPASIRRTGRGTSKRVSQSLAIELQGDNISVNVLSPQGGIKTPGNIWAANDRENPTLDFEAADDMGKGTLWIGAHPPPQYPANRPSAQALVQAQTL